MTRATANTNGPHLIDGGDVHEYDVVMHEGARRFITKIEPYTGPLGEPGWRVAFVDGELWKILAPGDQYTVYGRVTP